MNNRHRRSLYALLTLLRELESDKDSTKVLFNLQHALRSRIVRAERQLRTVTDRRAKLKHSIRSGRHSKDKARELKRQLARCDDARAGNQLLLRDLRSIGDGIAYLYFDRYDLKPLAFKEEPGFISGKAGSRLEIAILRALCKHHKKAILCDVTNVLRYGDIAIADDGYPPRFLEVKSSDTKNARVQRQADNLTKMADYLHDDSPLEVDGFKVMRRALVATPKHHEQQFNEVIASAYASENACAYVEPEPGLIYFAIAPHVREDAKPLDSLLGKLGKVPSVAFLNTAKDSWASYFPYSLSIRHIDHVLDFMAGELCLFVVSDMEVFVKHFDDLGFRAELFHDDDKYVAKLVPKESGRAEVDHMHVGQHFFRRILLECLSMRSLVTECAERARTGPFGEAPHEPSAPACADPKPTGSPEGLH